MRTTVCKTMRRRGGSAVRRRVSIQGNGERDFEKGKCWEDASCAYDVDFQHAIGYVEFA